MICLKASTDAGKTKREYIEDVIDDCKLIFNAAFADQFFHDDNLKVAFCTSADQASVFEEFCGKYFPLYLDKNYSRTDYFAAQAMTNVSEDICGILICLDTLDEGEIWYQIILHEMSHIFCITNELDGENVHVKYSKEKMGDDPRYHFLHVGYAIWREFVADYMASELNPFSETYSLTDLRKVVRQLDKNVNLDHPERAQIYSQILVSVFQNPRVAQAADASDAVQILEKNRVFPPQNRRNYCATMELLFHQLAQEPFWKLNVDFIEKLGETYLKILFCETYSILEGLV